MGEPGGQCACAGRHGEEMEEAEAGEQVTEMWYQLPAEEDASSFFPTLSETGVRGEQTDFPSMEEGTIQSEADLQKGIPGGRTLPLQLDFQDSRLSPCLPLLTSVPEHKFFEDTLFQQTETEFAPLRASLDMSEFPDPGSMSLQMMDAVKLASKEVLMVQEEDDLTLSHHDEERSLDGGVNLSSVQYLSEHPLNVSQEDDTITENIHSGLGVLKEMEQPSVEDLMAEDGAFLGNNVPAPILLELLEKEVGMSAGSGSSSRRSSQTASASETDNIDVPSREPREDKVSILEAQGQAKTPTGLNLEEETFRDSSEIHFDDLDLEKANLHIPGRLDQSGITVRRSSPGLGDELQKQLCTEIQQEGKKRAMSDIQRSKQDSSSFSQSAPGPLENITKPSYRGEDAIEEQPRGELTVSSHCSIERGHKESDMSTAANTPIDEASFILRLRYPISQSTPGIFSMNRKQLSGRIQQIKAKLTGSDMSLNEEPHSSPLQPTEVASGVQSSQGYPESSDSQGSLSPPRRKIQSLPSLNYIEKVGSWNTNQSFDTLVLRGLSGVSPKKLAYNAVADSLNRTLSKQTGSNTSKKGLDASMKGTSSMINLNIEHKESSSSSQLTRSQSYNSVITAVSGNHTEKRMEADVGPLAEEGDKGDKSSTVQASEAPGTTSFLSRDGSDHEKKGSSLGKKDAAHGSSDYVERIEDSSLKQENVLDGSTRPLNKNLFAMEHFSDVSLDQEFSGSSHTSDNVGDVLQNSAGSSGLEMSHRQGEPLMQEWSAEDATPEKDEFNIEERIPTYLRNLGIDQSPTSILMPFTPKGPIREPEFSPTELRTIKSSTATPNRSMGLSEGESQTGANISQSSLYSTASTASISIPMGSDIGPESPLPIEPSPQFSSRSTDDRPISQDDTATRDGNQEVFSAQRLDGGERKQLSPDAQELNDLGSTGHLLRDNDNVAEDSSHVKQLIGQFESAGSDVHQDNVEQVNLGSLSSSWKKPHLMDSTNDSFVGSKTLKEIRKLLAEADDVNLDGTASDFNPKSPLRDPSITVPAVSYSFQDSLKSGATSSRSASPLDLQLNNMSWDTSFNSSVTSDHVLNNGSPAKADWHWKDHSAGFSPGRDSSHLEDDFKGNLHLLAPSSLHKHGRSEPEGSSEATANRMAPPSVQLQDGSVGRSVDFNGEGLRSEQLISGVTRAVGGLKHVLDATGSSYVRSTGEESDASSGDSLAARVKSLLKNNTLSYTSQVRQTAEDENQRGRGSVKLKLASQPTPADDDLSEEDRRRIEEIKRELLDGAKGAEKVKSHQQSSLEIGPMRANEHFRLQLTPSPLPDQYHATSSQDSLENSAVQLAASTSGASDVQPGSMNFGNIKAVATVTTQSDQPPLISRHLHQGLTTDLHTPVSDRSVSDLDRKTSAIKYGEEAIKPIASITFSSRKRSSPLPTSTSTETDELSSATRHFGYDKSLADPYYKDKPLADRYYKDKPLDLYDNDKPRAGPYYTDKPCADLYGKDKPLADLYGKDKPLADPYYRDMPLADPYFKDKSLTDLYGKDKPLTDVYGKDKPLADLYDNDKPLTDLYGKDKPLTDPYYRDMPLADPYLKDKPLADLYDKDKPLTDLYGKEKPLADLLYKDNQFSETTRSNIIHHSSSMDNTIPQHASMSDPTDKGGVLGQNDIVSENQGEFDWIKSHVHPDLPSVLDRNSSMTEESYEPPVVRPRKPTSLQEDFTGPSHSALITRSLVMSELPQQISDINTKEWKFYPELIHSEKIQREETYGFPSQELKTEPNAITSPSRKALSCIRVTISPKEDLNVSSIMVASGAGNEAQTFRSSSDLAKSEQVLTSHSLSSVPLGGPYFLHSPPRTSQGEYRTSREDNVQLKDKENIPEKATMTEQRWLPLFDATTQITTESPEKTTFSAEIYINGSLKEASSSTIVQTQKTPERQPGMALSSLSRATDQPLLLPYRPPGSPELFYVPVMDGGSRMSPVSTIESSHPGSNDAVSPKFPTEVLGSAAERNSDTSIPRHKDGIYSKDYSPKIAWEGNAGEKRKTRVTVESSHNDIKASYCSLQHRVLHLEPASKDFQRETRDLPRPEPSSKDFQRETRDLPCPEPASKDFHRETRDLPRPEPSSKDFYREKRDLSRPEPSSKDFHREKRDLPRPGPKDFHRETRDLPYPEPSSKDFHRETRDHLPRPDPASKDFQREKRDLSRLEPASKDIHREKRDLSRPEPASKDFQKEMRDHLPHPEPKDFHREKRDLPHSEPSSKDFQRETRDLRSAHQDDEFFPLKPEVDYVQEERPSGSLLKKMESCDPGSKITNYSRRDKQEQTSGTPFNSPFGSQELKLGVHKKHVRYEDRDISTKSFHRSESTLSQSAVSNQSLDDLWARYTKRQKNHLSESHNKMEVSLVERLDRLARLLQNPTPYSLVAAKDDKNGDQTLKVNKRDDQKRRETKKEEREKWYLKKFGMDARLGNGISVRDETENQGGPVSQLSESASSERVLSGGSLYSDFSEVRSSATEESAGRSEAATGTDSTSTLATSSSLSTIDTVRLINAFGPERVRPSSKLSRLYTTIDLQKKRTEGTSKKASRSSAGRGHSTKEMEDLHKSLNQMADTDSVSSSTSSEPRPAMRSKNGIKVLNKGIQAGDLEIVTSATKRHTRDVGTTFPSPGGEMPKPSMEREVPTHNGCAFGRPKNKQYIAPGLSWFVPADDMKCDAPKENKLSGPGPAWYESMTNPKPWREPLRERNQQGPAIRREESHTNRSELSKDDKTVQPFVRVTLQESLKAHRPDFIFRSGERVKRLQLLTKERKLQSTFQNEREALFNHPERRGGPAYRASYKESQKMRSVPRKEMVQRSKRLYKQLPEIKKRKEEEKRRSEYETYRLKAQLFRKKVTNKILGRKTPWN